MTHHALLIALLGTLTGAARLIAADPPPKAPPQTPVDQTRVPPDLADWTPRPATGPAEPWEKATDKDWVDGRFRLTDTGPFLNATFRYPIGRGSEVVYKGTAIRLGEKGDAGVLFDRNTLRLAAGWTGGYLAHGDRRFGLLNTPTPAGRVMFSTAAGPGWSDAGGRLGVVGTRYTHPLPAEWARYRGLYVHGDRVAFAYTVGGVEVLETARRRVAAGQPQIVRTVRVAPSDKPLTLMTWGGPRVVPPGSEPRVFAQTTGGEDVPAEDIEALTKPGPRRWGEPLVTKLIRGDEAGPLAVDTLTLPYDNPHKALFFCTGLDFLPDGRVAVCNCHGDVWLARIDEAAGTVSWQRFATGLYHPLGLKVVDGKVVVLERGQLTRLHDSNADGEADFYECVTNAWHCGGGEHSYDTCLETDPAGNFYFFKTGDTDTPHGGCLMRVSKDGATCEVFATGFRHPIGMGMSPNGVLTGADQEGNWMPATRIDQYRPGGFYGDMRAHHRAVPPATFDPPLCWLPREVDNSAGGQCWVPADSKWPLAGLPLHFSYGRCKPFVLLRQELPNGMVQGGAVDLGVRFLSGVCRGRFRPADGHLYVCGLNGWQTAAKADGCVQRVRYTGKPLDVPAKMEVVADGVKLTFTRPLDRAKAADPANYRAAWWNYRWSGDYGSKRWKASNPAAEGQDDVPVTAAEVSEDGKTVLVKVGRVRPVMQMQVGYNVAAADGAKMAGSVYLTVNGVP